MILLAACNRRSDDCFQPQGKVNFNYRANSPEALPNFAQGFGHLCPKHLFFLIKRFYHVSKDFL